MMTTTKTRNKLAEYVHFHVLMVSSIYTKGVFERHDLYEILLCKGDEKVKRRETKQKVVEITIDPTD